MLNKITTKAYHLLMQKLNKTILKLSTIYIFISLDFNRFENAHPSTLIGTFRHRWSRWRLDSLHYLVSLPL